VADGNSAQVPPLATVTHYITEEHLGVDATQANFFEKWLLNHYEILFIKFALFADPVQPYSMN